MRLSNSSTSPTSIGAGGTNSTAEAESTPADQLVPNSPAQPARDSSWLELDVCRDYQRRSCPRDANTCRFAHPENNPPFKSKVTCCYDFLKVGSPRFNSSAFFFCWEKGILTTVTGKNSKVGYCDQLQYSGIQWMSFLNCASQAWVQLTDALLWFCLISQLVDQTFVKQVSIRALLTKHLLLTT